MRPTAQSTARWLGGLLLAGGLCALLVWAFREGREELERERAQEKPIKVPPRVGVSAEGLPVLELSREAQEHLALQTARLEDATLAPEKSAHGQVVDPSGLVALEAEISGLEAALRQANAALDRQRALATGDSLASRRAIEAAEAEQALAESRQRSARGRLLLAWGVPPETWNGAQLRDLADRLAHRRSVLARISLLLDERIDERMGALPCSARVAMIGDDARWIPSSAVWPAPGADDVSRGQSFWVRVDDPPASLAAGVPIEGRLVLSGQPREGVIVPRSALVRSRGKAWVYVQTDDDHFTRREVSLEEPLAAGWFTSGVLEPGTRLVVRGAQVLLSEELKSQIQIGEEGEGE